MDLPEKLRIPKSAAIILLLIAFFSISSCKKENQEVECRLSSIHESSSYSSVTTKFEYDPTRTLLTSACRHDNDRGGSICYSYRYNEFGELASYMIDRTFPADEFDPNFTPAQISFESGNMNWDGRESYLQELYEQGAYRGYTHYFEFDDEIKIIRTSVDGIDTVSQDTHTYRFDSSEKRLTISIWNAVGSNYVTELHYDEHSLNPNLIDQNLADLKRMPWLKFNSLDDRKTYSINASGDTTLTSGGGIGIEYLPNKCHYPKYHRTIGSNAWLAQYFYE